MLDRAGQDASVQDIAQPDGAGRAIRRSTLRRGVPAVAGIATAVAAAFLPAPEMGAGEPDSTRPWEGTVPFEVAERPSSTP
jgi:hypothetical protein